MNFLRPEKIEAIRQLFEVGESNRFISRATGAHQMTVLSYTKKFRAERASPVICRCGRLAFHRGWCSYRVSKSPARQAFLAGWSIGRPSGRSSGIIHEPKPKVREIYTQQLCWPFIGNGSTPDELLLEISRALPRHLAEHIRADVGQDIAVAVITGELRREDIPLAVKKFISAVYKMHPQKFGPLSLDAPIPGTNNLTILDTLIAPEPYQEEAA